ncbi:hypothetical protein BH11PSE8_BH11PSE8_19690 [soil metagenome]
MKRPWYVAAALFLAAPCHAQLDFGGQVRPEWIAQQANPRGPIAQAASLQPGIVALPPSGPIVETELRASSHGMNGTLTLQQQHSEADGTPATTRNRAWVNELYASHSGASWQFAAGKRIVAWDVGYAFRPNDVVEQEVRRTLLSVTPEGRPVLMAEHFDASTAWSFVLVNPTAPHARRGAEEPALAARVYRRDGAVDWHGFARVGAHTGASVGAAAAWVANESLELHASLRAMHAADSLRLDAAAAGLVRSDPWQAAAVRNTAQALVGGTWTNIDQISLLAEAWWDGTALPDAQWDAWNARNRQLAGLAQTAAPRAALAGNLAWQASAFDASTSLRRANLYARLSWQHDAWQPAIDMLYTPADAGRVITASLGRQGDRLRIDGGLRFFGGPADAVLAQVPTRRIVYLAGTWTF